jgi:hypothetical protein
LEDSTGASVGTARGFWIMAWTAWEGPASARPRVRGGVEGVSIEPAAALAADGEAAANLERRLYSLYLSAVKQRHSCEITEVDKSSERTTDRLLDGPLCRARKSLSHSEP